jgi:hypothetical protein
MYVSVCGRFLGQRFVHGMCSVALSWTVVTTLAGAGTFGATDGSGTIAAFIYPSGVAVDASGNVFVADQYNYCIRKITMGGGTRIGLVTLRALQACMVERWREMFWGSSLLQSSTLLSSSLA